jgi:hypothetical protein
MASELLSSPWARGILIGRVPKYPCLTQEERAMTKLWAVLLILASFLLVAPVIESGTSESTEVFQAIGTADGGS